MFYFASLEHNRREKTLSGQNQVDLRHRIIHFPTSSRVSEQASKQMSAAERASNASRVEPVDERCERMSEWMSKWPGTCISILGCYTHSTSSSSFHQVRAILMSLLVKGGVDVIKRGHRQNASSSSSSKSVVVVVVVVTINKRCE